MVGGCLFIDWVRWEARLVKEGKEEEGLAEFLAMAGSSPCAVPKMEHQKGVSIMQVNQVVAIWFFAKMVV